MSRERYNVSSITNAMRGKTLLDRNGIRCHISRTVDVDVKNGCGYSIDVSSDFDRAQRILFSSGIHIRSKQRIEDDHVHR